MTPTDDTIPVTLDPPVVEPPVPIVEGSGLPDLDTIVSDDSSVFLDEIDCDRAEELAEWGEYEAADIADYCDIGPEPGELPDEFDWDN